MTDLEKRFIKARRDAIAVDYQNLNDCQRQGVPGEGEWLDCVRQYEKDVMSKR